MILKFLSIASRPHGEKEVNSESCGNAKPALVGPAAEYGEPMSTRATELDRHVTFEKTIRTLWPRDKMSQVQNSIIG